MKLSTEPQTFQTCLRHALGEFFSIFSHCKRHTTSQKVTIQSSQKTMSTVHNENLTKEIVVSDRSKIGSAKKLMREAI